VLPCVVGGEESMAGGAALPAMFHTFNVMMERLDRHNLSLARGRVHLLPAPVVPGANPMDFNHSADLIELGFATAQRWLAERVVPEPSARLREYAYAAE